MWRHCSRSPPSHIPLTSIITTTTQFLLKFLFHLCSFLLSDLELKSSWKVMLTVKTWLIYSMIVPVIPRKSWLYPLLNRKDRNCLVKSEYTIIRNISTSFTHTRARIQIPSKLFKAFLFLRFWYAKNWKKNYWPPLQRERCIYIKLLLVSMCVSVLLCIYIKIFFEVI